MPAIATAPNLSNYSKLKISSYRDQLRMTQPNSLPVSYSYSGKQYSYLIHLTTTTAHYGGSRYWFNCPQCSQRTSVLYCAGKYACRHCIGAKYDSQLCQPIDLVYSRLNALRERLRWQVGIIHGIGDKPKGMHHSTFKRLLNEYEQLQQQVIGDYYANA